MIDSIFIIQYFPFSLIMSSVLFSILVSFSWCLLSIAGRFYQDFLIYCPATGGSLKSLNYATVINITSAQLYISTSIVLLDTSVINKNKLFHSPSVMIYLLPVPRLSNSSPLSVTLYIALWNHVAHRRMYGAPLSGHACCLWYMIWGPQSVKVIFDYWFQCPRMNDNFNEYHRQEKI